MPGVCAVDAPCSGITDTNSVLCYLCVMYAVFTIVVVAAVLFSANAITFHGENGKTVTVDTSRPYDHTRLMAALETAPVPATPHTYGHHAECRDSIIVWTDEYRFVYDVGRQTHGCNAWDVPAYMDQHRLKRAFQNGTAFTCTTYGWARTMDVPVVWWCVADEQPDVGFQAFIRCPRVSGTTLDVYARDCVVEFNVVKVVPFWHVTAVMVILVCFYVQGAATEFFTVLWTWRSKRKTA